jgi:hypothetical protein
MATAAIRQPERTFEMNYLDFIPDLNNTQIVILVGIYFLLRPLIHMLPLQKAIQWLLTGGKKKKAATIADVATYCRMMPMLTPEERMNIEAEFKAQLAVSAPHLRDVLYNEIKNHRYANTFRGVFLKGELDAATLASSLKPNAPHHIDEEGGMNS